AWYGLKRLPQRSVATTIRGFVWVASTIGSPGHPINADLFPVVDKTCQAATGAAGSVLGPRACEPRPVEHGVRVRNPWPPGALGIGRDESPRTRPSPRRVGGGHCFLGTGSPVTPIHFFATALGHNAR